MGKDIRARLKVEPTPLIDGNTVTFAWRGVNPPRLVGDFNGWEWGGGTELDPAGKDLWATSVELPEDAYVEYAFVNGDPMAEGSKRRADSHNPRRITNGMGKFNHFFFMPGAQLTPYANKHNGAPEGTISEAVIAAEGLVVGGKRKVHFYQPPVEEPCPLLVVWDGQDYRSRALLPVIVDNLVNEGRIQPVALAMVEHGGKARMIEYGCCEMTLGFIISQVLPMAAQRCNLLDLAENPGAYGVAGASMGGLMALYTGLRLPDVFGKVLSQSGAFTLDNYEMVVWDLVRSADPHKGKFYLDAGTMEYLLDCNRHMAALLEERGFDFVYHEYNGGHNYTCWQNDLPDALTALFPA